MGNFRLKKITDLKKVSLEDIIPESDYSLVTNQDKFLQWEFVKDEEKLEPRDVKPGIWTITKTLAGLSLSPTSFTKENVLEEYSATRDISDRIHKFFSNTEMYKKYGVFPKRGILLYGSAGLGKSVAIGKVCKDLEANKDTCIIVWNTDKFDASEINSFVKSFDYSKHKVKKFVLVVEDIGGFEMDQIRMKSDSSLLALLDNVEQTFKIPTVVIATTNFITNFLENLTNRPGRFDDKIEIKPPSPTARAKFLEFFSNSEATTEDLDEIKSKEYNKFSIAHVKEAFIRSRIYGISLVDSIRQIDSEIRLYEKAFQDKIKRMGLSGLDD